MSKEGVSKLKASAGISDIIVEVTAFGRTGGHSFSSYTRDWQTLNYVCAGRGAYAIDGVRYDLGEGDLLHVPYHSHKSKEAHEDAPMQIFTMNVDCVGRDGRRVDLPFPPVSHIGVDPDIVSLYRDLNRAWTDRDSVSQLEIQGLATQVIGRLFTRAGERHVAGAARRRITEIKHYIADNLQRRVDVRDIADHLRLNPVYVGAQFRSATGETLKSYINRVRIQRARQLLGDVGYNVSDVAYRCGFGDVRYFSKLFKKLTGVSPSSLIR